MPWNPKIYNKFKNIRFQPFFDLAELIRPVEKMKAIDLGCGTGEQTAILSDKFKDAIFLGVDTSAEMLERSKTLESDRLHFHMASTETMISSGEKWDLIFSNAALHWSDHHETLFPAIIQQLNTGGQLAVQMPVQNENLLNRILFDLATEQPFQSFLKGWKQSSPVLSMDEYARILFEHGLSDIQIVQKVYPIIAEDHQTLYDFISGSALIPYLERLEGAEKQLFIATYQERIATHFPKLPAIYAFKRLLLYGMK